MLETEKSDKIGIVKQNYNSFQKFGALECCWFHQLIRQHAGENIQAHSFEQKRFERKRFERKRFERKHFERKRFVQKRFGLKEHWTKAL